MSMKNKLGLLAGMAAMAMMDGNVLATGTAPSGERFRVSKSPLTKKQRKARAKAKAGKVMRKKQRK